MWLTSETVSPWGSLGPAAEMLVSNDPSFTDAVWQSFAPSFVWTLTPGAGSRTVYVRLRDGQGSEAATKVSIDRSQ